MTPREPEDVLEELEAQAREDEAAEKELRAVAAMSDAELDAELAAAGIEPEDVARMAEAARARAAEPKGGGAVAVAVDQDAPREKWQREKEPRAEAKGRRRVVLWIAAAATVTVGAGALVYALTQPEQPAPPEPSAPPLPTHAPPESRDLVAAAELRHDAAAACNASQFAECVRLLDEAKQKDPLGDRTKTVKELREKATHAQAPDPLEDGGRK